jgi:hypothetical protein
MRTSSSSSSVTCWTAATTPVFLPSSAIRRTPWPPRCFAGTRERDALAVAGLGQDEQVGSGSTTLIATTLSPAA